MLGKEEHHMRDCLFDRCSHPPCIRARHFSEDWLDAIDEDEERFPREDDDRYPDDRKDYEGPSCGEYDFQRGDYQGIR
jgi:hypothetical protein